MTALDTMRVLRLETGLGVGKLKEAMDASGGDLDKARQWLRANTKAKIESPADPSAQGKIAVYAHHNGNIATMVHLACQTDFTARSPEFVNLADSIAMHIAAARPRWLSIAEVPPEIEAAERRLVTERCVTEGHTGNRLEQVVTGRMRAFYNEHVLTEQPFVRDPAVHIGRMLHDLSAKTGEPITIKRMALFEIGR